SYTRLQNSLKVAGLEGENLANVQQRLLDLSGRYGVNIEELARLFGNSSQAASELGASQDQLITLTEATAQSLKITGTSAAQAQGAILGLTQALASGTVRAEEFNQINEGGLRPLLQLAANTEQFGGSVAKLRQAVVDGKVSSEQFFQAILNGSAELEGKASKATLTIAGAFESLNSQLTVYVGEASKTSGASQALAAGIQALADNLDVVIPAVAVLSAALGVGFVTNLTRTAIAAGGAGTALLGAFGGPVGLAITAVAVGLGYVATEAAKTQAETERLSQAYDDLRARLDAAAQRAGEAASGITQGGNAAQSANPLIIGIGNAYKFAADQAALLAKNAKLATLADIERERTANKNQLAKLEADQRLSRRAGQAVSILAPVADFITGGRDQRSRRQSERADTIRTLRNRIKDLDERAKIAAALPEAAFEPPAPPKPAGAPPAARVSRARGAVPASSASSLTQSDIDGAARQLRDVGATLTDAIRRVDDYARQQFDLATAGNQNEQDLTRAALQLAETRQERADLEARLIDLQFSQERAEQELVLATIGSSETAKEIARARLAVLDALQNQARREAGIANQSPGQRFLRDLGISGANINDQFESVAVDGLQSLNDGLVDAIVNAKSLGQVFSGVAKQIVADLLRIAIQQAVIRPLAESLFGGGGGGGGFGGILSFASLFAGRASGGPVSAGRLYRVNEAAGAGGVELFQPAQNGNIVPLGQARAAMNGGQQSISGTITISLSEDIDG
ncbi:tape measure protein, partial [Blastomonas sp. CCH1-A6]|uniref:tape measure protein n=1 Tax=Blastomonas sp. CCH1-A6 TaxID=1768762 RepID=UPI0008378966